MTYRKELMADFFVKHLLTSFVALIVACPLTNDAISCMITDSIV